MQQIDESHPCYQFKYLKNKPVRDLAQDQFLRIVQAEEDHIMTYEITIDDVDASQAAAGDRLQTYFEEIKQLYHRVRMVYCIQTMN